MFEEFDINYRKTVKETIKCPCCGKPSDFSDRMCVKCEDEYKHSTVQLDLEIVEEMK
jgi:hypothetical protein